MRHGDTNVAQEYFGSVVNEGIMAKTSPMEFLREVRQEVAKVTWPTRKETGMTTLMVFIMVFIAATFFFTVDQILALSVRWILSLGA